MLGVRLILVIAAVFLAACPSEMPPPATDGPTPPIDVRPPVDMGVCANEQIFGPYDPAAPLYGEPCGAGEIGCRPDQSVPGGYAGVCVEGFCRPACGYYMGPPGVSIEQCCLRGGFKTTSAAGICGCTP